ncbi:MAG TPA: 2-amino-4-hydroxy-6-hydroxymethyldihydropteridine diphosphokinase [Novosphingobium sp.]|nr:2-amino-4-hydroxy-6-hydroxymethyldihydropteridine diphosphokinase [Novosphingobium sp.]
MGLYLVALGSNVRHPRHGPPREVLAAALEALNEAGLEVVAASTVVDSAALGPSRRRYANAVAVLATDLEPPGLLAALHAVEAAFGRRRRGRAWGPRVLDLDIVLWRGGSWHSPGLAIPHPRFHEREFVLGPAAQVARGWRDPPTGLTLAALAARLTRPRPAPTSPPGAGP